MGLRIAPDVEDERLATDKPLLATDKPLLALGNKALLSPHMVSSNLGGGLHPMAVWATKSVLSALRGGIPDNVYNKKVGRTLRRPKSVERSHRVTRKA